MSPEEEASVMIRGWASKMPEEIKPLFLIWESMMPALASIVDGECKDCQCDPCVTIRGAVSGLDSYMEKHI
jgi:hypothetical protein